MKFKSLRKFIFCPCNVLEGDVEYKCINTHEETAFDSKEVIGIRSRDLKINGHSAGSYIEVLVK